MNDPTAQQAQDAYAQAQGNFLAALGPGCSVAALYHAVRNLRYASRGARDGASALSRGEGSCSGKHVLLRDLLRRRGERAEIETVAGDFAAAIPPRPSMPPELRALCRPGWMKDFHNYVVWHSPSGEQRLDATWPDLLAAEGFTVNTGWHGQGDTVLALAPTGMRDRREDIGAYKSLLLEAELTASERAARQHFLRLLTDWLDTVQQKQNLGGRHGT